MDRIVSGIAFAAGLIAVPSLAHAGTSAATGAASMNVVNQCSVAGATIDLGTYTFSDGWSGVGNELGFYWWGFGNFRVGSRGADFANFGSVTCDAGTPYTLSIKGTATSAPGLVKLSLNGSSAYFRPTLRYLGGQYVPGGMGATGLDLATQNLSATGTGSPQSMIGAVYFSDRVTADAVSVYDPFAGTGVATDTLTYTLNF